MNIDSTKLDTLVNRAVGDLSAGYGGVMISLGHKLGLYRAMAGAGPLSSAELARKSECTERYVREWLNAQVAGGYVAYHPSSETYELTPEQALVFAEDASPVFIPTAWQVPASMWFDEGEAIEAFRTGKGVAWGDHDARLYCGVAAFYRNAYQASLVQEWLPALEGVTGKLARGARVADVGCGHGHSTVIMAKAFPASRFWGFDVHGESIAEARRVAEKAGVAERVHSPRRAPPATPRKARPHLLLRLPARHGASRARARPRRQGARPRRQRHAGRALCQGPRRGQYQPGQPRPRRAGRRGAACRARPCQRLLEIPPCQGDAVQPDPGGAPVKRPTVQRFPGCIIARMNDKTERTRTREAVSQNKVAFGILALLAIMGLVGWLTSL